MIAAKRRVHSALISAESRLEERGHEQDLSQRAKAARQRREDAEKNLVHERHKAGIHDGGKGERLYQVGLDVLGAWSNHVVGLEATNNA